jgi:hypothetical protein
MLQANDSRQSLVVKDTLRFSHPAKILAASVCILGNDAGGATIKISKAALGASITASGNVAILTVPASNQQGKMIYKNLQDSSIEVSGATEVQIEVTAESVSTLNAVVILDMERLDEPLANISAAVASS